MKLSNYIYAAIASVFLLTLGACRAEEDFPTFDKEDCYQIQFGLSILPPQTRALKTEKGEPDPLNENKITKMDAFIYDGNVQKGHYSTEKGDLVISNTTDVSGTATIYVPKTSNLSGEYSGHNYDLYVLVNYHGAQNLDNVSLHDLQGIKMTSDELLQSTVAPQADFLMDGNMKTGAMSWPAGAIDYNITTTTGQTLKLSRAAAKVRIRLDADIKIMDGKFEYDVVGEPTITFKSFTNQTSLFAGSPARNLTYQSIDVDQPMVQSTYDGKQFWARAVPYYCYENDWNLDAQVRTYAVFKLRVKKKGEADDTATDSYYSVPLNYLAVKDGMTKEEIEGIAKVQRNHLYDIHCSIKQLGSAEPTKPVDIPTSYIAVEEWNTPDAIDAAITKAHYLVVKETHPEMLNISERLVEYLSDLPIDKTKLKNSIRFKYTQYEKDGRQTEKTGSDKNGQIKVELVEQNGKKYLKIISPIPDNYVPLTIYFTVTQEQDPDDPSATPLYKDVEVTQYPPIYVTAKKSSGNPIYWYSSFTNWNPTGPTGSGGYQSNGTLFKVTTLAPQKDQIVGDPTSGTDKTGKDEEANKITSPEFIVASQWGMSGAVRQYGGNNTGSWVDMRLNYQAITGKQDAYAYRSNSNGGFDSYRYRDYSSAEERAYNYWEDEYGISGPKTIYGNTSGDGIQTYRGGRISNNITMSWNPTFKYEGHWRIPTLAELALIVKIQRDPNSAVKSLLWGHQYWSAQTNMGYDFENDRNYPSGETLSIRPVFDTYNISEEKW